VAVDSQSDSCVARRRCRAQLLEECLHKCAEVEFLGEDKIQFIVDGMSNERSKGK
jgi:hypothetical protein